MNQDGPSLIIEAPPPPPGPHLGKDVNVFKYMLDLLYPPYEVRTGDTMV